MIHVLNKIFKIQQNNSNIKTELLAAITTFLSCSYILFVNPLILGHTGMDAKAVFLATALSSIVGCLLMAFVANLPIATSVSMGSNGWFAFTIVLGMGFSWQQGLAAVFIGGLLFILFTATKLRVYLINALSNNIKYAISAGIGLFIASLGLKLSGIIISNKDTIMALGNPFSLPFIMTIIGILFITILNYYRIKGNLVITIFVLSIFGLFFHESSFSGIFSSPPSLSPLFFKLDFSKILESSFISIAIAVFFIDFLDATGTFISLLPEINERISSTRAKRGLFVDGIATPIGALLGSPTIAAYVESASGIAQGGRTGLVAFFIALFFGISIFFSPLLSLIPTWATCPVLIYVGSLMFGNIIKINTKDITEIVPAFITILVMPLTGSIGNGIGLGLTSWVILKIFTGKFYIKTHWILLLIVLGYIEMLINL